jgi:hypothetical protein
VATWLLGLAGGMGVSVVSTDVGYRGVAAGAALAAGSWLYQLPPRAALRRQASRFLLGAALAAAVVAGIPQTPLPWFGYATAAAVLLIATAVLIPADTDQATVLLAGAAIIGVGIWGIGVGIAVLAGGGILNGTAVIGLAVAIINFGIALLRGGRTLFGATALGLGLVFVGAGVVALLRGGRTLIGATVLGGGIASIGLGSITLRSGDILIGAAGIVVGLELVVFGIALLRPGGGRTLFGATALGGGIWSIGLGSIILRGGDTLLGATYIGSGIALTGAVGNMLVKAGTVGRIRDNLITLLRDPDQDDAVQLDTATDTGTDPALLAALRAQVRDQVEQLPKLPPAGHGLTCRSGTTYSPSPSQRPVNHARIRPTWWTCCPNRRAPSSCSAVRAAR